MGPTPSSNQGVYQGIQLGASIEAPSATRLKVK